MIESGSRIQRGYVFGYTVGVGVGIRTYVGVRLGVAIGARRKGSGRCSRVGV